MIERARWYSAIATLSVLVLLAFNALRDRRVVAADPAGDRDRGSQGLEAAVSAYPLAHRTPDGEPRAAGAAEELEVALARGLPLRVSAPVGGRGREVPAIRPFDLMVRPMRALSAGFQITIGNDARSSMGTSPKVFEGWAVLPATGQRLGRATVAVVDGFLAAAVRERDGATVELRTNPETGSYEALRLGTASLDARCSLMPTPHAPVAAITSASAGFTEEDWQPIEIAPQWGSDPATGEITKYEQPIPNGERYDLSLPEATVMVVLAKDATGDDSPANLASVSSTYVARMANIATIWENQLGVRLLVSELILTPDTPAYDDVGDTLDAFRLWGEANRPRWQYPRAVAARFGNLGFSGNTVGFGYVGGVGSSAGYSINRTNYNFTLVAHEMGHNFGSNHSSGGVMNARLRQGQRDFFRDVTSGETAAKDIYDHANGRLLGSATMRHAEEIPFAVDDAVTTAVDTPLFFDPLENDQPSVRNGATNSLSIAEASRVFPIGAGTVEVVDGSLLYFTPAAGFEGFAWFSYSLQGDVGNGGEGWLHRGDVSVLVGSDPGDPENITLAPGESILFEPPGSGGSTITVAPVQALADVTRDDNQLIVIRAFASATGSDSFVVRRSGVDHTINVTYVPQALQSTPDVVVVEPGQSEVRFNPVANDDGVGFRRPRQLDSRVGFDGASESYFANSLRLVDAINLSPEKGLLTIEGLPVVVDGVTENGFSGNMRFATAPGATGVARVQYTLEDAAGNQSTETVSIVLSLVEIVEPGSPSVNIPEGVGLQLSVMTDSSAGGRLSGEVDVLWEVVSEPVEGGASIGNPSAEIAAVEFSAAGSYLLRVTGSDNGFGTSTELAVFVGNTAPGGENLGALVDLADAVQTHTAAGAFDLSPSVVAVADDGLPSPPGSTTTRWSQVSGAGPVEFADVAVAGTTAVFPYPGEYALQLEADDGEVITFDRLTVVYSGPGNGTPVTSGISDLELAPGASPVAIDLFAVFEDGEDGDSELAYTLEANTNPAIFGSASISGDPEQLTLSFAAAVTGASELTVRATDTDGAFVDTSFTVTLSDAAPSISPIADQTVAEGETLSIGVDAASNSGSDLTFSLVSGSPAGVSLDPATGALTWTPGEADGPGDLPVMVRVTDDTAGAPSAIELFRVTVEEVNRPPELSPIEDVVDFAGTEFTLVAGASDPDLPANSLRYSLDAGPPGASIDPLDGTVRWTPTAAGSYEFTVRINDQGSPNLSDTESFSVVVANAAPTVDDQSFTIAENSPEGALVGSVQASDGDGHPFSYSISGGDDTAAFQIDASTGSLSVAAGAVLDFEASPTIDLEIAVMDEGLPPLTRTATVTVQLADVNEAPSLPDQTLPVAIGEAFGAVVGVVAATDPEDDPLTFSILSGNDAGVFALDPTTGAISIAAVGVELTSPPVLTIGVNDGGAPPLDDTGGVTLVPTLKLVADPADVRVLVPADGSAAAVWKGIPFDDSTWTGGQAGVGYERDTGYETLINTDVEADMFNANASVWVRVPFEAAAPTSLSTLTLRMKYDDGFVAYLNGVEIARRNAPAGEPAWDAAAAASRDDASAILFEDIDVAAALGSLVEGTNVLAIHGMNADAGGSDLLISPELLATGAGTIGVPALAELAAGTTSSVTDTGAVLRGELLFDGGEDPEVFAVWGTSDGGTEAGAWQNSASIGVVDEGAFSLPVGNLVADTEYWFRFYAENSAGRAWSPPTGGFTSTPVLVEETLVAEGATVSVRVPTDASEGAGWRGLLFDDSAWTVGTTGVGYERSSGYQELIGTDVEAEMYDQNASVYLRIPFDLVDPDSLVSLTLRMKYDDAYVAYVNGVEVAQSAGVPNILSWDSEATTQHSDQAAVVFEDVDIFGVAAGVLQEGTNVLAVHGLNAGATSSDLLFVPELVTSYAQVSYWGWIAGFPELSGSDLQKLADPDGDRLNNFLEFAFGLDPTIAEAGGAGGGLVRPEITRVADEGGSAPGAFEMRYRRRIDYQSLGLIYEVESSGHPSGGEFDWFPAFAFPTGEAVPTGDGVTEEVTVRIVPSDFGFDPRLFFRVSVFTGGKS